MIFNKQYLIKLTFITFSVWVIPAAIAPELETLNVEATAPDLETLNVEATGPVDLVKLKRLCRELLKTSLKLEDCVNKNEKNFETGQEGVKQSIIDDFFKKMKAEIEAIEKAVNKPWMNKLAALIYKNDNIARVLGLVLLHFQEYIKENDVKKDDVEKNDVKKDDVEKNDVKKDVSLFNTMLSSVPNALSSVKNFLGISYKTQMVKPFCEARITPEKYITSLTEILDIKKYIEEDENDEESNDENV